MEVRIKICHNSAFLNWLHVTSHTKQSARYIAAIQEVRHHLECQESPMSLAELCSLVLHLLSKCRVPETCTILLEKLPVWIPLLRLRNTQYAYSLNSQSYQDISVAVNIYHICRPEHAILSQTSYWTIVPSMSSHHFQSRSDICFNSSFGYSIYPVKVVLWWW